MSRQGFTQCEISWDDAGVWILFFLPNLHGQGLQIFFISIEHNVLGNSLENYFYFCFSEIVVYFLEIKDVFKNHKVNKNKIP